MAFGTNSRSFPVQVLGRSLKPHRPDKKPIGEFVSGRLRSGGPRPACAALGATEGAAHRA
jgi:hypothetical protein